MNAKIKTTQSLIAVYCGSRTGNDPIYLEKAIELAQHIAHHNLGVVYGGASIGLMGQVADTALQHGGEVVGVIPEFMLGHEIAHNELTELHIVKTMHERKFIMAERAVAFIALPGGFGTFEEILEIATWSQLRQHNKTMILYNVNHFYDALITQLDHAVNEGFLPPEHRAKLIVCQTIEEIDSLLTKLNSTEKTLV